ncbi:MAG: hypothetical protein HYX85_00645 [Chloroflexi bacterium]|nr:hypothetical protein [Chloroflexota bacterium]
MHIDDEKIREAVARTRILRPPKRNLYTFGSTKLYYYLVTEPIYVEFAGGAPETVVREGRVVAERPKIVTPYYLMRLEGFGEEARRYFAALAREHGSGFAGLLYAYKNEPKEMNIVSEPLPAVVDRLNARIDQRGDPLSAIITGADELWDVSLLKFILEVTRTSAPENWRELGRRGHLGSDESGIPDDARRHIEELFLQVDNGETPLSALKGELDRWGVFEEYEDRFYSLFNRSG